MNTVMYEKNLNRAENYSVDVSKFTKELLGDRKMPDIAYNEWYWKYNQNSERVIYFNA